MMNEAKTEKELALPSEHWEVWQTIANSKEKYNTKNTILAKLRKDTSYTRRLHTIIHELVAVYIMPLGSSSRKESKGYFVIRDKHDLYLAKRNLQSRKLTINKRYEALENIDL